MADFASPYRVQNRCREADQVAGSTQLGQTHLRRPRTSAIVRKFVESFVLLGIGLALVRVFLAEAYVVPSGSMAPGLLGVHTDRICPRCQIVFDLGLEGETSDLGKPVCPNCGNPDVEGAFQTLSEGDRVLVQKHFYAFRAPRRWEVAVFSGPEGNGQPFVKRVAGLPGEEVQIRDGDLYINGRIQPKSLAEQRAVRVLVYDHDHQPADYAFNPRWIVHGGNKSGEESTTTWQPIPGGFQAQGKGQPAEETDWLSYRHWQPDREATGPIRDYLSYNGVGLGGDYRVEDLMLETEVALSEPDQPILFTLGRGRDRLEVALSAGAGAQPEVRQNGQRVVICPGPGKLQVSAGGALRFTRVEVSYFDHRLLVAMNGQLAFDPVDFPTQDSGPPCPAPVLAIGVRGGAATVRHLRVFRDIYYTPQLSGLFQPGFGVAKPYQLGPDEYFLLGDNSEISHDSRFWSTGPVVRREEFIGKPILVHLPGRMRPWFWLGRAPFWVPDFREIRYIR